MKRRFVGTLLSLLLLAVPSGVSHAATDIGPLGVIKPHIERPTTADTKAQTAARPRRKRNLRYFGGRVLPKSTTYLIFWNPFGVETPFPSQYESTIDQYFDDTAADSGTTSNVYSVMGQYYDQFAHHANYDVTNAGSFSATDPVIDGCSPHGHQGFTHCVNDAQIRHEISTLFTLPDPTDIFFVFLPEHMDTCASGVGCVGGGGFCAYHSAFSSGGDAFLYANEPFADFTFTWGGTCTAGHEPQGHNADPTINTASHEHIETITDPFGNAWLDRSGNEIADKCAYRFAPYLGADYNQVINGRNYVLQKEWSNFARSCLLNAS